MSNDSNQNIGAKELSYLLLGSNSSSLPTTADSQNPLSSLLNKHKSKNSSRSRGDNDADISGMDAAQASLLLKQKHGVGKLSAQGGGIMAGGSRSAGGMKRHYRLENVKKRGGGGVVRDYHLGIQDYQTTGGGGERSTVSTRQEKKTFYHDDNDDDDNAEEGRGGDEEDDGVFQIKSKRKQRAKTQNVLHLEQQREEGQKKVDRNVRSSEDSDSQSDSSLARRREIRRRRRRRHTSKSSSSSSSEGSSSDSSSDTNIRRRRRRRRGRSNNDTSSSSDGSSSDEDDSALQRRNRARKLMMEKREVQKEAENRLSTTSRVTAIESEDESGRGNKCATNDTVPKKITSSNRNQTEKEIPTRRVGSSSSESSSDSDDSSSGSSSSDTSSDEEQPIPFQSSKPMFVPKHKRNIIVTQTQEEQKQKDKYEQEQLLKEKRIRTSRAIVAEVVATEKENQQNESLYNGGDQNEFSESGGAAIPPPNDHDPTTEEDKMKQRDVWEVRELLRLLRDFEEYVHIQEEVKERERRRNMTEDERLQEDINSGKYRKPGEQRRQQRSEKDDGVYLQRYFHRGAFYMDEDSLSKDKNDVRHRAAEYANAATGEDKVNLKALPKVMQVKKFGFAGQHKYKGLAKEDTTDKSISYLPVKRYRDK